MHRLLLFTKIKIVWCYTDFCNEVENYRLIFATSFLWGEQNLKPNPHTNVYYSRFRRTRRKSGDKLEQINQGRVSCPFPGVALSRNEINRVIFEINRFDFECE